MTRFVPALSIIILLTSCNTSPEKPETMEAPKNDTPNESTAKDTTPKVTGIGGIFFFSDNPKATQDWYAKNLGVEMNDWGGSSFESRDIANPEQINSLQWTPFKKESDYFEPSKKEFMINYRVQNIEGLVQQLRENGVTVVDSITTYDYGKFVHIMDADGNKIELWEPS